MELDTDRRQGIVNKQCRQETVPILFDGDSLCGSVTVRTMDDKEFKHKGIFIELFGVCESFNENYDEFLYQPKNMALPGIIPRTWKYSFQFIDVKMPFESYNGTHVHLRYFLRVTVYNLLHSVTKECPFLVYSPTLLNDTADTSQKGITWSEDGLELKILLIKERFYLKDVFVGQIRFTKVTKKVKSMEIQIIKSEIVDYSGISLFAKEDILVKIEIVDGDPVCGECVPFRVFLGNLPLTPTYHNVKMMFSVHYFIHLVLCDESNLTIYKTWELPLYRDQYLYEGICLPCSTDYVSMMNLHQDIGTSSDNRATETPSSTGCNNRNASAGNAGDVEKGVSVTNELTTGDVFTGKEVNVTDKETGQSDQTRCSELTKAGLSPVLPFQTQQHL